VLLGEQLRDHLGEILAGREELDDGDKVLIARKRVCEAGEGNEHGQVVLVIPVIPVLDAVKQPRAEGLLLEGLPPLCFPWALVIWALQHANGSGGFNSLDALLDNLAVGCRPDGGDLCCWSSVVICKPPIGGFASYDLTGQNYLERALSDSEFRHVGSFTVLTEAKIFRVEIVDGINLPV
jgi:hypothetical protein